VPPSGWRTFEVTTRVEVLTSSAATRVWLPAALISETPYQRTLANRFHAEGGVARIVESKIDALGNRCRGISSRGEAGPHTHEPGRDKDYAVDLAAPAKAPNADSAELRYCLQATKLLPTMAS
jgi:hypothetical protein